MVTAMATTTTATAATLTTTTAATTATAKATATIYDGDGGDDADGDKTQGARSVLCRQRLMVRRLPVYHGYKFKEKTFPCLIQTGEGFSLNLHLAKVNAPDPHSRPHGTARRGKILEHRRK